MHMHRKSIFPSGAMRRCRPQARAKADLEHACDIAYNQLMEAGEELSVVLKTRQWMDHDPYADWEYLEAKQRKLERAMRRILSRRRRWFNSRGGVSGCARARSRRRSFRMPKPRRVCLLVVQSRCTEALAISVLTCMRVPCPYTHEGVQSAASWFDPDSSSQKQTNRNSSSTSSSTSCTSAGLSQAALPGRPLWAKFGLCQCLCLCQCLGVPSHCSQGAQRTAIQRVSLS